MKLKILISVFSLVAAILITLVCWWIYDCPKLQSNTDALLLMMVEIALYNTLKILLTREE